jgi:hypothetical protein
MPILSQLIMTEHCQVRVDGQNATLLVYPERDSMIP